MTDTEKEHKEYAGLIDGVSISFRRDEASGVYYVKLARRDGDTEKKLTVNDGEFIGDGDMDFLFAKDGMFLFYCKEDSQKYRRAHNLDALTIKSTDKGNPFGFKFPLPGAISPMGIYENYFMPTGYKPLKDTKL
jgi:hypothetical protein